MRRLCLFILAAVLSPGTNTFVGAAAAETGRMPWFFVQGLKIDTTSLLPVPDPLSGSNPEYPLVSTSVPDLGAPFQDPHFHTTLTRVTGGGFLRHEYSRFDPFNTDQSRILLLNIESGFAVYKGEALPYELESNRVMAMLDLAEPRWDPRDPDLIWGFREFSIMTVNVQTGSATMVKNFKNDSKIGSIIAAETDLFRIATRDEGESSCDKRYWALAFQGSDLDYALRYLFTWDRQQDQVLGLYSISAEEREIDWVGMSCLGGFVLIGGDPLNGGNLTGLTMANRELDRFHRLDYGTAHSDVALDADGKEVIVMQNVRTDYVDLIPIDWTTLPILNAGENCEGTNRTPLIRLYYASDNPDSFGSGIHISCNTPGYCVISTYIGPGEPERNWLDRTNVLVELNRNDPNVFYLSKVHNTTQEYWEETHATITNDGSKVL
ncbi:MAG: hypothetical protein HY788_04365 [Deltaproteobacteria bacterium]|nr:hypothetical protein [Deltaproteobacteria bacterium]